MALMGGVSIMLMVDFIFMLLLDVALCRAAVAQNGEDDQYTKGTKISPGTSWRR